MKGKAEKVLGIILALMSLGMVAAKVSSRPSDLPEKRSTQRAELVHPRQPRLAQNYGKPPLSFELNQGQTDARVRFLARGGGDTIFLTDDEAVLTLRKSSPGKSRLGKFGTVGRHGPFGPRAGRWPSLAEDWKSLSLIPDLSQLVPDPNAGKGAWWFDRPSPCPTRKRHSGSTEQSPRALRVHS
ncbi:MAG: hypothetical protein ABSF45_26620 [Terriglobia bacterium]|jgi:hypothetical protein